jgi:hypothetical protein
MIKDLCLALEDEDESQRSAAVTALAGIGYD